MKYLGKYGEYYVLQNLFKRDIESYLAIKVNQPDYDITVILNNNCVKRVQVKTTELHNKSKNNSIEGIDKNYDFLIIVIIDEQKIRPFILTKKEAQTEKNSRCKLSISNQENKKFKVIDTLLKYENKWDKISNP